MVYHPNEFETAVTLGQNEPLYCNVPDSLSESLARARLGERGLETDIKSIPKDNLDEVLQWLYAELIKKNREDYEPESLKAMITPLDRYLREYCGFSITI